MHISLLHYKVGGRMLAAWLVLCMLTASSVQAQTGRMKIAVFAPVYLDSVFEGGNYKLSNNSNLPRQVLPGLDFYNGILMAADTLGKENQPLEIVFFDSKSKTESLDQQLRSPSMKDCRLIIAAFNNKAEIKPVADFAKDRKIPLISMTYPNDGGIEENVFFALVNPTLKTHINGIYRYLHRYYPTDQILYFRKPGAAEDMIASMFQEMNKNTPGVPLKVKTINLPDSFSSAEVLPLLDSSRQNIVWCGSLQESFGLNLVKSISANKSYRAVIMGMPTWDALKDIGKDAEIIYSTPFNYSRTDKRAIALATRYRNMYAGRPSDMVFKAYEALYHFGKLLVMYPNDFIAHLSDKEPFVFNEFDFEPVKTNPASAIPDYLENKKLYFIRKVDGQVKSVQ